MTQLPRKGPTYDINVFRERARERRVGRKETAERKQAVLDALSSGLTVSRACQLANISRWAVKDWKRKDPIFKKLWDEALEAGVDTLEDEAIRRGRDGYGKPLVYQGQLTGDVVIEYSDACLIFMLKAKRYADRKEITGKDGSPLMPETKAVIPWAGLEQMSEDELQRIYSEQIEKTGPVEGES